MTIRTPGQPEKRYGIGAGDYHTGETVVLFDRRERRREIAHLGEARVAKHPTGTIDVARDNADTHQDDEVGAVVPPRRAGWSCCTCRPTAPGSTRSSCCGATPDAK